MIHCGIFGIECVAGNQTEMKSKKSATVTCSVPV